MNENAIVPNYFTLGKTNMLCVTKSTSSITHCINLDQLKKISTVIFVSQFAVEKEMGVKVKTKGNNCIQTSGHNVAKWIGFFFNGEMSFNIFINLAMPLVTSPTFINQDSYNI